MYEPGLDIHEWETRWVELEEAAADAPDQALAEMDRLIEQMLVERGFKLDEPVTVGGEEPEIVRQFFGSREVTRLAEAGEADPGDVADAIDAYRAIYEYLITDRAPP